MATVFESINLAGIRRADLRQLLEYVEQAEESGIYWGNRAQFMERHDRIKAMVKGAFEYAYSEGVRMPKARRAI